MGIFSLFLILGTLSRVAPHPANFTPVGALLIFYGAKKGYKQAVLLGLLVMVVSDLILGLSFATPFVYLGFAAYALFSFLYKKKGGIVIAPIVSSIAFFVITNFGVWLGPWYEHSLDGLVKCFTLAIPFYRNTVLGDIVFTVLLYSAYQIVIKINYKKIIVRMEGAWQQLLVVTSLKKR